MKYEFEKTIGTQKFRFFGDAESPADFFEQVNFFAALPETGPNGSTDVKVAFRDVEGNKYYSLVCEEEGMEFKLGIHKKNDGSLFPKQWEPMWGRGGTTQNSDAGGLGGDTPVSSDVGLGTQQYAPANEPEKPHVPKETTKKAEPATNNSQSVLAQFGIG